MGKSVCCSYLRACSLIGDSNDDKSINVVYYFLFIFWFLLLSPSSADILYRCFNTATMHGRLSFPGTCYVRGTSGSG